MTARERSVWPAVGGWLLIGALVLAIASAWLNNRQADGLYALGRANTLLREGRFLKATALLEETLKTYQVPQVRLSLSYAYLARRDSERAERQVRLALQSATPPQRPLLLVQLGRVLRFTGKDDEAWSAWLDAEDAAKSRTEAEARAAAMSSQWHRAMLLWQRGDWTAAQQELEVLTARDGPYTRSALVKLAQLYAPRDRAEYSRLADRVRALPAESVPVANMRLPDLSEGLTDAQSGRALVIMDRAAQEAVRLEPGQEAASLAIWGGAYLQAGEPRLAREYLERSIQADPSYAPAYSRLGLALFALGDEVAALEKVQRALDLYPDDPLTRHVLARIYTALGDWDRAEEHLRVLDRLQPDGVDTQLEWAEFYRLQGEYDLAEQEYIDAVNAQTVATALPPELQAIGVAENTNAALVLAHFYTDVRGSGCEKGLPAARRAVQLRPDDPAGFDAVGWALVLCGQPQDALSALRGAVERVPDEPRYRFHLGRAYSDLGMYAEARDQYEWARDLDPGGGWERLALNNIVTLPPVTP